MSSGSRSGRWSGRSWRYAAFFVALAALLGAFPADSPSLSAQGSPAAICRDGSSDAACGVPRCLTPNSEALLADDPTLTFVACDRDCGLNEALNALGACEAMCQWPFVPVVSGGCVEVLDAAHPCVAAGRVPAAVTSNLQLAGWVYIDGTDECVTHADLQTRLHNLKEISVAEDEALDDLREVSDELAAIEGELVVLDRELADARTAHRQAERSATERLKDWEAASAEVLELQDQIATEQNKLRDFAISAYMDGNTLVGPAATIETTQAFGVSTDYARSVLANQDQILRSIERLQQDAADREDSLGQAAVVALEAVNTVAAQQSEIDAAISSVEAKRTEQNDLWSAASGAAEELAQTRAATESSVGVLEASSDEIQSLLVDLAASDSSSSQFDGSLHIPLEGLINSSFGSRTHPFLGTPDFHRGVDIDSGYGEAIRAAIAGTVVAAGEHPGYGHTVVIDHGAGLSTLYAHQEAVAVATGQVLAKGDVLGYTGSSGFSTGPHLHFEIRVNGAPVDPTPYLNTIGS